MACLLGPLAATAGIRAADTAPKRWTDDELVASYRDLAAGGGLGKAVLNPALPKDPPQAAFLDALAWYAAGTPERPGVLSLARLDKVIQDNARSYQALLKGKVEGGEQNDYARTRTWKVIQKLTLLKDEMSKPSRKGEYPYPALHKAAADPGADPWDREHTLRTEAEFVEKVCGPSNVRPVLVKYGNTNCTQCMLFEIIGSVKDIAESPAHKGKIDVYKVWFGSRPDESFAGRIKDPERLEALAKAEGVKSSPTFVVYRNGRRYPCGDAFPDGSGSDAHLESCLNQDFGEAPVAGVCAPAARPAGTGGGK